MPSSSTRSTRLERHLRNLFKESHARLSYTSTEYEQDFVTKEFSELLDISVSDLLTVLEPRFTGTNLQEYRDEHETCKELKELVGKQKKSLNVWEAGRELAKVGTALFGVGMDEEARKWCEWGAELEGLGYQYQADGKKFGGGY